MYDRYQGLIFDMDGTLLDIEPSHLHAWHSVLSRYGMSFDPQIIRGLYGAPVNQIAQVILDRAGSDFDALRLAAEKKALVREMLFDTVKPLPLIEVVKAYKGKRPMSVGTGSDRSMALALLDHLHLRDYFTAIVTADDDTRHKPAPDTFLRCASLMAVPASQCVVFEDADFGIQAAEAAVMDVVDVRQLTE
ncbi:MAG: Fructose-1-phosphate phosphatase YqaB [Candidatus Erwinia impunctatus]|nr:Fructose-1-phosphate phosphatase YqaB [Culicoides impunctatus]